MKTYSFLFWAYATFWLLLAGYLLLALSGMKKVDRRLGEIESRLESSDSH
ncbi:MAG: hypothetical protein OEV00_07165 [Acidobacteriota bacterium]|nr:hypothetical protein [Acidobacteriota bacterium]MDH3785092.1 hypothetical protein [Acidobacteriota bacterium]